MRSWRSGARIAILVVTAMVVSMVLVPGTNARERKTIAFAGDAYDVTEGASSTQVEVYRNSIGSTASVVVSTTRGGTATAGTDYTAGPVTATFEADSQFASVTIPILVDGVPSEGTETVALKLSSPTKGWGITSPRTATLTIYELPRPPAPDINYTNPYNEVDLGWSMPTTWTYPTTYSVFRSTTTGEPGTFMPIASGMTVTYYRDADVVIGGTYWYLISATNAEGVATISNIVSITVQYS